MVNDPSAAYAAGQVAGRIFFLLLLLAGVIKCWSISRRPATNTKCVLSLLLVLASFLLVASVQMLATHLPVTTQRIVAGMAGIIMFIAFVTGVVLAVLGLIEYQQRKGEFNQGRWQAVWTLIFTLFLIGGSIFGFVKARQTAGKFASKNSVAANSIMRFDEFNFKFLSPASPWFSYDASKINKAARLSFMRSLPMGYFLIIPEKIGNLDITSEQLATVGKGNLETVATSHRVVSEGPSTVNGLRGWLVEFEAQVGGYDLHYRNWYLATNGFAYQLVSYAPENDYRSVEQEFTGMASRFSLIDSARIASVGSSTNYVSPGFHYVVNMKESGWHPLTSLATVMPNAEFGALNGSSCFVVVPIKLNGQNLSLDALSSGFLDLINVEYPNENVTDRRFLSQDGLEGMQFNFERELNGKFFLYRFKVLKNDLDAYFVAAWVGKGTSNADAILEDAQKRVTFHPATNLVSMLATDSAASDKEAKTQAFVINQAGLYYSKQGEHELALKLFKAAAELGTGRSIYVVNALYSYEQMDRAKDALEYLDTQPASILKLPAVKAKQAFFQAEDSQIDAAITNYAELFAHGYHEDSHLSEYVNLLVERKQYDRAQEVVQDYLKGGASLNARLLNAQIYSQKKDYPRAIELLKTLHDENPFKSQVQTSLANTYLLAGKYSEALETSRELVKGNNESAYGHFLEGRSELGLKWYREAKVSFASAVKLAPANKDMRSYLDYVSGLLGEGDNTGVTEAIKPVPVPAELTNAPAEAAPEDYAKKYGAYYIRRTVAMSYVPGKECKSTEYMLVHIKDASGVSEFSTIQRTFDPVAEQLYVNDLRVMDATGKTISVGDPANYYVLDDRTASAASQKKVLNIPVAGLQPDCLLAFTITQLQQGHLDEFPFQTHYFSGGVPVRDSVFFLAGDAAGLNYRSSPTIEPQKLPEGLCWRVKDPLVARWESLQPPAAEFLPVLWISDAALKWPTVASDYLTNIQDRLEPGPLAERARALVAGLDTQSAKIEALASYVQTNLTYKAIEFGRRARMPNKPAEIIQNKYGDCKDHAVLLQQMLAAAGVPAQLALVNIPGAVQKDLPSLDQFDHMIVFVPGASNCFLDCTLKGSDAAQTPSYLAEKEVLVLDPYNPRFVTVPNPPGDSSTLSIDRHLYLTNTTDLAAEETLTVTGDSAGWLRDYLSRISESNRRTWLQTQMGMNDANVTGAKIDSLTAPDAPLRLTFAYIVKGQFRKSGGQLRGVLPAGFSRFYLQTSPEEDRVTPFEIRTSYSIRSKTIFDLPVGFQTEKTDAPRGQEDPRFTTANADVTTQSGELILNFKFHKLTGRFKASDYPAYRDSTAQALSLLEREVVLKSDGH